MNYQVHRLEVDSKTMQEQLEKFINQLRGEVIAVLPNVAPTFRWLMGATAKVDFLLVVEKLR